MTSATNAPKECFDKQEESENISNNINNNLPGIKKEFDKPKPNNILNR